MIRKLMRSIREQKKDSIWAMITIGIEVVFEVIIPLLMANLIDYGIDAGNMNYVVKMGIVLLLAAAGQLVSGIISGRFAASASSGFARNLRHDMFYKVQTFSFSNIDKFSPASIVTRLTTDVTNLQNTYQMIIRMAVRSPLMMIFSLVASFSIDANLSIIFLAIIPVLAFGLYFIMIKTHPIFERVFRTYDKLNNVVQENLHGIRVVKSFVRETHEEEKFNTISERIYKNFKKAEQQLAWNAPLMQICMYAAIILLSWFGARAVVACGGDAALGLSTGELLSLISYATQILMSLMGLSMVFVMITISRTSGERAVELLDETPDITPPDNAVTEVADGSISFEHVMFSYHRNKGKPVLDDINLHIPAGSTVGIIGVTGASKSSLVQLIPRLYDVREGAVKVGGVDVREYDLDVLRDAVAMVLQKNVLFSGTIKENLRWGNEHATDEELVHVCKLAQADDFIRAFPEGYDTYIEQGGTNVSGGQKQRLCIARALLKHPKILILDDSTSAVDTRTDALIREAFAKEIPDTTKLIIAQRIASVEHADMILVLEDGKIMACGKHEELIASSPIYKEVYESQTKGDDDSAS
ncbi:ABC transporter ATP-binding protein [Phocea massiliensis]|uniref:ABC transporter ATP-binding protein n=1 Tax=Merdimmobilis hominis TaxID=2897707 RepID=A0A938X7G2_9FIRM|nr:ABC transporter ATP-binding protein [Merdimmobilis hominis]MBM6921305.1 ABC transporter ATP-binding protein [Merdimmobilis hominis]